MARAPKPARLNIDGSWGPKTRAAFDYVVNTSLRTGGTVTTNSDTALNSLSPGEKAALQNYLNNDYSSWKTVYVGGVNGWQTMAKLTVDGLFGWRTSRALTNFLAYMAGVKGSFWLNNGTTGGLTQWKTPTVRHLQRWINCAVYHERFVLAGAASWDYCHVPYLP